MTLSEFRNAKHIVVDCETLSLDPYAIILSVGAVVVADGQVTDRCMHSALSVEVQELSYGRHRSKETEAWWKLHQGGLDGIMSMPARHPEEVLSELDDLFGRESVDYVWAQGPQADVVWLESLYRDADWLPPWDYRQIRDIRTLLDWDPYARNLPRVLPSHHALFDARYSAEQLSLALGRKRV